MVIRMRHTRAHTANRRSHHALSAANLATCPKCSAPYVRHRLCPNCGSYKGITKIDTTDISVKGDSKKKKN